MTKKVLNQNAKYVQELINYIEPDFIFSSKPINRIKSITENQDKNKKLENLKFKINSIQNCNLKLNSKNLILGDGDINSPIMLIGEAPGDIEDNLGLTFQGEIGSLLEKMLLAINIKKKNTYSAYLVNFKLPEDRRPTAQEIKRYSVFLKEHITIINPKIIILMGGSAMQAITGSNNKVSNERGKWKEIILKNKTYPIMTTFSRLT